MEQVTVDDLKKAVTEHDIRIWPLRQCSMCLTSLTYAFDGDRITYDANCSCVTYTRPPEKRSWDSVAEIFNMQTPDARERMWDEFVAAGQPAK